MVQKKKKHVNRNKERIAIIPVCIIIYVLVPPPPSLILRASLNCYRLQQNIRTSSVFTTVA